MSCWSGILKCASIFSGAFDAERAESLARHVGGELEVAEAELDAPVLENAADSALSHVAVFEAAGLLGDAPEEVAVGEVSHLVEVAEALLAGDAALLGH